MLSAKTGEVRDPMLQRPSSILCHGNRPVMQTLESTYYLHWGGRGFATAGDMQGGVAGGFDSSASGRPDPFFTMPNTSHSLVAGMGQISRGREKEKKANVMEK